MEQIRLKVSRQILEAIKDLSDKRGQSLEETLRHAVNTEVYINEQLEKGNKFLVQDKKGSVWGVVFSHVQ